ncbi:HAD-IA family hydrolase [Vibrio sp.]|uniref:HAD-IA family hydrolase n=1 Tax=Vibrio sp. TaxID=678 RepID=UPI003D13D812
MDGQKIRCVIFDCDGTLVDSESLCCQALVAVFNRFGAHLGFEDALSHFEGGKLADILVATSERLGVDVSLDILEPLYRAELQLLFEQHLKPMPGARQLLDTLDRQSVEYCVASNGPLEKVEQSLAITGLLPKFQGKIFSAFDTNAWKPEPDLVRYSVMSMGFSLNECLYVDDTPKGVEAGLRAGIKTIQLLGPYARPCGKEVIAIHKLSEVANYLGRYCPSTAH